MKFQVPQFIEIEDKIFGPLTLKQFIYLAGAGGIVFVFQSFLPLLFAIIAAAPIIILAVALAFYKVNKRPFINVLESAFRYAINKRLYIWKKADGKTKKKVEEKEQEFDMKVPKLSQSRLKDLSWSLDIKENVK